MSDPEGGLSGSAAKVQSALDQFNMEFHVLELPGSTRTAEDAAQAIGCVVGQIAKSLVFRFSESGSPILVIASGSNQVDIGQVGGLLGEKIELGDADFVRAATGFAIGGVPPVGHLTAIRTLVDQDLMSYEVIWAAAGTPRAVFRLTPEELVSITKGEVLRVY
jgi:prolyl-tRNA editing enzyme YbaK/EbsC (Cys-tRNA(Pro) deacylase)